MCLKLSENLKKFYEITLQIIETLEEENYDELKSLIDSRQKLINIMNTLTYTKGEFKKICDQLELTKAEEIVNIILNEKKNKFKSLIAEANSSRTAHQNYRKISYSQMNLLNIQM